MKKESIKALASTVLMSLVLTTALSSGAVKASPGQVTRVGEVDRYATAAKVATTNWSTANDVVLVCGEGYADAVSSSVLAKQLNAPILLTESKELNESVKSALNTLKPTNIYVIGGTASVSQAVRDSLKASKYNLVELGGKDRYETNVKVAEKLINLGVKADNVMIVGGEGFSDALSVAPVAAAKGQILLLGNNDKTSMSSILTFVKNNNSNTTVIGTSYVINDDMYSQLKAVLRINGGSDRFETNLNVLNSFKDDLKMDKLFIANASGDGYADALVASALAGKTASPLVLVDKEKSSATSNALTYIKNHATKATDLNVIGGKGVVTEGTVSDINASITIDENKTNPIITLKGDSTITLNINDKFVEPGFTAVDNKSTDISSSVTVSGTVDTSKVGTYTLKYDVTDSQGNKATEVIRTVVVKDTDSTQANWVKTPSYDGIRTMITGTVDFNQVKSVKATDSTGASFTATLNQDGTFLIDASNMEMGYVTVNAYDADNKVVITKTDVIRGF